VAAAQLLVLMLVLALVAAACTCDSPGGKRCFAVRQSHWCHHLVAHASLSLNISTVLCICCALSKACALPYPACSCGISCIWIAFRQLACHDVHDIAGLAHSRIQPEPCSSKQINSLHCSSSSSTGRNSYVQVLEPGAPA
jgi:hypothetical protein